MRAEIPYKLIRSSRKTISLQINQEGELVVRAPNRCRKSDVEAFISSKADWIIQNQREMQRRRQQLAERRKEQPEWTDKDYVKARSLARAVFEQKVSLYAKLMQVSYGRISIRDQKTRWGSCSGRGNLNFNWRLILAPEEVLDYVVVHELAHRKEMNHSDRFWAQVAAVMPDYRKQRQWLKQNGDLLMSR